MQLSADIATEDKSIVLRASGRQLLFDGWLKAWEEPLAGAPIGAFFGGSGHQDSQPEAPNPESGDESAEHGGQPPGNAQGTILSVSQPAPACSGAAPA